MLGESTIIILCFFKQILKTKLLEEVVRHRQYTQRMIGGYQLDYKFMFYVYILVSLKDKNFYVGSTQDLVRRIAEHKKGKVKSTKNRLPIKLVCYEAYLFKEEMFTREKFLKTSDGRKDLRKRLTKSLIFEK